MEFWRCTHLFGKYTRALHLATTQYWLCLLRFARESGLGEWRWPITIQRTHYLYYNAPPDYYNNKLCALFIFFFFLITRSGASGQSHLPARRVSINQQLRLVWRCDASSHAVVYPCYIYSVVIIFRIAKIYGFARGKKNKHRVVVKRWENSTKPVSRMIIIKKSDTRRFDEQTDRYVMGFLISAYTKCNLI